MFYSGTVLSSKLRLTDAHTEKPKTTNLLANVVFEVVNGVRLIFVHSVLQMAPKKAALGHKNPTVRHRWVEPSLEEVFSLVKK